MIIPKRLFLHLSFLFLILICNTLVAQPSHLHSGDTSMLSKYQAETIYLRFSTYVKNEEVYQIGAIGEIIKKDMLVSPDAMIVFKKYQKQKKWSIVLTVLQVASQVTAFSTRDKSLRKGLLIGSGAVSVISIPIYIGSQRNLNTAVWLRNRDALLR